jgi:hypothetical protein
MGVSVVGASGRSLARIRTSAIALGVISGLAFYAYGPLVTPVLYGAASSRCNEIAGSNFRSYHLEWTVGTHPHWLCWDRSDLAAGPVDMGWWVTPSF